MKTPNNAIFKMLISDGEERSLFRILRLKYEIETHIFDGFDFIYQTSNKHLKISAVLSTSSQN